MNPISSLLTGTRVSLDVEVRDKKSLFQEAAALLHSGSGLTQQQITDALMSRERMGSTALGQGIAIPHGRVKGLKEASGAFLRLRTPLAFDAPDDLPVKLVFVLLVPERDPELHLQILSTLAAMFGDRDLRAQLASASDAPAAQQIISSFQAALPNR